MTGNVAHEINNPLNINKVMRTLSKKVSRITKQIEEAYSESIKIDVNRANFCFVVSFPDMEILNSEVASKKTRSNNIYWVGRSEPF